MSQPNQPRRVPAARGLRWILDAGDLLGRGLGPLAAVAALLLLLSMLQLVPLIGPPALMLFMPLLTGGLILAFRQVERGQRPSPMVLFAGWQRVSTRMALLVLGLWLLMAMLALIVVASMWLGAAAAPDELERLMASPEQLATFLAERNLLGLLLPAGLILAAALAALYFAIPLVLFSQAPPLRAMRASIRACLINWLAFLVFGLACVGLALALGIVLGLVAVVVELALGEAGALLVQIIMLIAMLLFQLLMTGAQYRAFKDVFGLPETPAASADDNTDGHEDGNHLVA